MSGALREHEAIAEAILSREARIAAEQMSMHLRNGLQSVYHRHSS
jgi:DNA-binding GntR family transcriptional regulator